MTGMERDLCCWRSGSRWSIGSYRQLKYSDDRSGDYRYINLCGTSEDKTIFAADRCRSRNCCGWTFILSVNTSNSENFRLRRRITWLDPENHADEAGFQVMQGLYAIGSGGFFGKGLGNSTQKLGIIPEAQNDMILTIVCEELGVFGAIVVLVLFGLLLYRLMFIARNAPDLYGSLSDSGIFANISLQVILNICRCNQHDADNGSYITVYQLWRYVDFVPDDRDGNCTGCIPEN